MLKELSPADKVSIFKVINSAAVAYKGVIPADRYHEPYMTEAGLAAEMAAMKFFGWEADSKIVAVMGFQPVKDVTLIRHAYVLPAYQKQGIGTKLLEHIKRLVKTRLLLVGTWADAGWAVRFYEQHGFELMPDKDGLLKKYWNIPERQVATSVVLGIIIK